jgi:predicted dehydrogenase/threonine dehydrogenase-like Zn-dependent dehydrogenase
VKQVLQSLGRGTTEVADVPTPVPSRGQVLIRTSRSLISAGTERMVVEFGQANMLQKARQQPDKVRQALEKVKTDGLLLTLESIRNKLDQSVPLGYCNVGTVMAVGPNVTAFDVGDRVASNGMHAEVVSVPINLCARVPASVIDDAAAFTVLGAIALQSVRLIQPTLGESVVVTGLGLIGLMAVQLLRANGCRVLGIDYDPAKTALARQFGAQTVDLASGEDPVAAGMAFSKGRGVDAVIVAASTTSNDPVHQAALMSRQRGRIVLVGVAGLQLSREAFYKKELTFQVSSSYGPGRYDPNYEVKGQDYPVGFVRWTEQRNFEAVLDMMADGRLDVASLITHRFGIDDAERAYDLIASDAPSLGVLLDYPEQSAADQRRTVSISVETSAEHKAATPTVSFIGAGNYASGVLIPAFKAAGARLRSIASSGGVSGLHAGRKFGFEETTTDTKTLLAAGDDQAVVIATRHDQHAALAIEALLAGKDVFVEKPLCMDHSELQSIERVCSELSAKRSMPRLMVGFNRRFAPHVVEMKRLLKATPGQKALVMTVNAGSIPRDHWTQDSSVGGGRLIGEGCHFIDLLRFLVAASIVEHRLLLMDSQTRDTLSIQLKFADGSIGLVHYFANGSKRFPKERLEVFANGGILQLDNYRTLRGFGWPGFKSMKLWRQDKGQGACAAAFVDAIRTGKPSPIPLDELMEVARVSIDLAATT